MRTIMTLIALTLTLLPHWLLPIPANSVSCGKAVAVASPQGAFLVYPNGTVEKVLDGQFLWVTGKGPFVFSTYDKAYVVSHGIKEVELPTTGPAKLEGDTLYVCGKGCYALRGGEVLWEAEAVSAGKFAYSSGYLYVPAYSALYVLDAKDGRVVDEVPAWKLGGIALSADACGKYLAVTTPASVVLLSLNEPSKPKVVWVNKDVWGTDVTFSPKCEYLATTEGKEVVVLALNGTVAAKLELWRQATALSWGELLVVASPQGFVIALSR